MGDDSATPPALPEVGPSDLQDPSAVPASEHPPEEPTPPPAKEPWWRFLRPRRKPDEMPSGRAGSVAQLSRRSDPAPAVSRETAPGRHPLPWPPAVALFNLTGLGLGYLYLRRWIRWAIHFVVTVGLFVAAYLTNATSYWLAWMIAWGVWLLWMVFDGWFQAFRSQRIAPERVTRRRWLSLALGVWAVSIVAAGVWTYLYLGWKEFNTAMAAYRSGDCRPALERFSWVTSFYELTLSSNTAIADAKIVECRQLIGAEDAWRRGEYAGAIASYEDYLQRYPSGEPLPFVRNSVAQVYSDWAAALRQQKDYPAAIEKYEIILDTYAETSIGQQAAALAAEAYAEWGADLHAADRHADAIEKYRTILARYPDTPMGQQAGNMAAATYETWAAQLRQSGQYAEAIEKYTVVASDFPGSPVPAHALAAEAYWDWAAQLRQEEACESALEKYQTILAAYGEAPISRDVRPAVAETYREWAALLRRDYRFDEAVRRYEHILGEYADTATGQQATALLIETYAEWGAYLWEDKSYTEAILKFLHIAENYPTTAEASTAVVTVGHIYNDWGEALVSNRRFYEAMEKFDLARETTADAAVVAAAEAGLQSALFGLSSDTTGEGKALLDLAVENVCNGDPTDSPAIGLLEDEPGRARYGGSLFTLPNDIKAVKPGHLRYVVCAETDTTVLERCPYTGGHTLVRRRRWWQVRIYDPRSGGLLHERTFYGPYPDRCPQTWRFSTTVDYLTGGAPAADAVIEWLREIVR